MNGNNEVSLSHTTTTGTSSTNLSPPVLNFNGTCSSVSSISVGGSLINEEDVTVDLQNERNGSGMKWHQRFLLYEQFSYPIDAIVVPVLETVMIERASQITALEPTSGALTSDCSIASLLQSEQCIPSNNMPYDSTQQPATETESSTRKPPISTKTNRSRSSKSSKSTSDSILRSSEESSDWHDEGSRVSLSTRITRGRPTSSRYYKSNNDLSSSRMTRSQTNAMKNTVATETDACRLLRSSSIDSRRNDFTR
ncbi:hypothetical protein DICVIV_02924 [Dictyocaulus viviparus]|uniref:Uncharacterized protein n=1 Tax=Dictyocaulus viviparus TaxID=29172 RepID=A0A0D8Y2D5_DICVI|nr:hypothetical protein DICVIV_02924 [Dictyocaulus viviparus]